MATPVIVDSHIHYYGDDKQYQQNRATYEVWEYGKKDPQFSSYGGDPGDILKAMKVAGATKSVCVNLFAVSRVRRRAISDLPAGLTEEQKKKAMPEIEAKMSRKLKATNMECCDWCAKQKGTVSYIAIDPGVLSTKDMKDHMDDMLKNHGARGVKLHQGLQEFFMNDKRMKPLIEHCIELNLPILAHSGALRGEHQYVEPNSYAETLKAFPKLTLVLAHLGGGSWKQTTTLAKAFPNVYFDCCGIIEWAGAPDAPTNQQLAQMIKDVGPQRVMMGSDFPWYDIKRSVDQVMALPLLSRQEKENILGANAERILKI